MVHGDPKVLRIAVQRHRNLLDPYSGFSPDSTLRTQFLPKVAVIKIIFGLDSLEKKCERDKSDPASARCTNLTLWESVLTNNPGKLLDT